MQVAYMGENGVLGGGMEGGCVEGERLGVGRVFWG